MSSVADFFVSLVCALWRSEMLRHVSDGEYSATNWPFSEPHKRADVSYSADFFGNVTRAAIYTDARAMAPSEKGKPTGYMGRYRKNSRHKWKNPRIRTM